MVPAVIHAHHTHTSSCPPALEAISSLTMVAMSYPLWGISMCLRLRRILKPCSDNLIANNNHVMKQIALSCSVTRIFSMWVCGCGTWTLATYPTAPCLRVQRVHLNWSIVSHGCHVVIWCACKLAPLLLPKPDPVVEMRPHNWQNSTYSGGMLRKGAQSGTQGVSLSSEKGDRHAAHRRVVLPSHCPPVRIRRDFQSESRRRVIRITFHRL